jgi:hypothetical protein
MDAGTIFEATESVHLRFTVIGWANRSVFDADFLVCDDAIGALTIGWQLAEDMKIVSH